MGYLKDTKIGILDFEKHTLKPIKSVPNTIQQMISLPNNMCAYTYAGAFQINILDLNSLKENTIEVTNPYCPFILMNKNTLATREVSKLILWDLTTLKQIKSIEFNINIYCLCKLSDNVIAIGGNKGRVIILNIKNEKRLAFNLNSPSTLYSSEDGITSIGKLSKNKLAVSKFNRIEIFDFNLTPPKCIYTYPTSALDSVHALFILNNEIIYTKPSGLGKLSNERFNLEDKIKILKKVKETKKRKISQIEDLTIS